MSIDNLLNRVNKNIKKTSTKTNSATSPVSESKKHKNPLIEERNNLKSQLNSLKESKLPEELKTSQRNGIIKRINEINNLVKDIEIKEQKEEDVLLEKISKLIDNKLENFFKEKVVLSESTNNGQEITIAIGGHIFKGKMTKIN